MVRPETRAEAVEIEKNRNQPATKPGCCRVSTVARWGGLQDCELGWLQVFSLGLRSSDLLLLSPLKGLGFGLREWNISDVHFRI